MLAAEDAETMGRELIHAHTPLPFHPQVPMLPRSQPKEHTCSALHHSAAPQTWKWIAAQTPGVRPGMDEAERVQARDQPNSYRRSRGSPQVSRSPGSMDVLAILSVGGPAILFPFHAGCIRSRKHGNGGQKAGRKGRVRAGANSFPLPFLLSPVLRATYVANTHARCPTIQLLVGG